MQLKTNLFLILLFASKIHVNAQNIVTDSLLHYSKLIINGTSDLEKTEANNRFYILLQKTLKSTNYNSVDFAQIKILTQLSSTNKQIKIFNWALPLTDGTYQYFGFIQNVKKKK